MLKKILLHIVLAMHLLIFLSSCNGQSGSQNAKTTKRAPTFGNVVAKLPQSIWVIYQDEKLNFWFGSKENGIFQYNGQELIHFNKEDGLIGNQIRGIQEDTFGNIYFETTEGISKFDGKSFKSLEINQNPSTIHQWTLGPNDLWFSSGYHKKGPYRYNGKQLYYHEFPKSPEEDNFNTKYPNTTHSPYGIYSIFKDSKGHVWFGTSDMGIYRFDGKTMRYLYEKQLTETPSGGAFGIRSMAEDKNGHMWICNSTYKYKIFQDTTRNNRLRPINYERLNGIKSKEVEYFLSMATDNDENLWMLTFDNGVWKNNGIALTHYPIKDGGNTVKLFSIFKDKQGVLWLGTQNSGVYTFNGDSFEKFEL